MFEGVDDITVISNIWPQSRQPYMVMSDIRFGKIFRLPVKSVQINNISRRQTPTSRQSFSLDVCLVDTINVRLSDGKI